MLQEAVHLLDGEFHGEELVKQAKCSGRSSAISGHPRLDVVDLIVNLVDDFMIGLQPVKLLEVIGGENVHT